MIGNLNIHQSLAVFNGGFLVLVLSLWAMPKLDAVSQWRQAQEAIARNEQQGRIQQQQIEQQRLTADTYRDNHLAEVPSLLIHDYTANPATAPDIDWQQTVDPSQLTIIYDRHRACIGHAIAGQFISIYEHSTACNPEDN